MVERLDAANWSARTAALRSIGIGWRNSNVDNDDIFGDEVNLACKLGEDIAERGMIVLTEAARAEFLYASSTRQDRRAPG